MSKRKDVVSIELKLGDVVEWSSQAQGHSKSKQGVVVAIVPPGQRPDRDQFIDLYKGPGVGFGRKHVSYVIRVGRSKHYWPFANKLSLISNTSTTKAEVQ